MDQPKRRGSEVNDTKRRRFIVRTKLETFITLLNVIDDIVRFLSYFLHRLDSIKTQSF